MHHSAIPLPNCYSVIACAFIIVTLNNGYCTYSCLVSSYSYLVSTYSQFTSIYISIFQCFKNKPVGHISIFNAEKLKSKRISGKTKKNQRTFRPFHLSRPRRRFVRGYYCNIEHRMSYISLACFHLYHIRVSKRIDLPVTHPFFNTTKSKGNGVFHNI